MNFSDLIIPEVVSYSVIFMFGIILIIQDWRFMQIDLWAALGFLISCVTHNLLNRAEFCFVPFLIIVSIGVFSGILFRKKVFGTGDYVITFAISFVMPEQMWPFFLILSGGIGVLTSLILKESKIPFIPALIFASFLIKLYFLFA